MNPTKTRETRGRKSITKSVKKIIPGKVRKTVNEKQERESSRKKGNLVKKITGNFPAPKSVRKMNGGGNNENKITNFLGKTPI